MAPTGSPALRLCPPAPAPCAASPAVALSTWQLRLPRPSRAGPAPCACAAATAPAPAAAPAQMTPFASREDLNPLGPRSLAPSQQQPEAPSQELAPAPSQQQPAALSQQHPALAGPLPGAAPHLVSPLAHVSPLSLVSQCSSSSRSSSKGSTRTRATGASGGLPEQGLRVAYQGVPGAYSEMAAQKAYPDCMPVPCSQFEDAFLAVEQWLVDRAVLPIENSLGGSIHRNYDLLLRHRLHIVGEVQLPVHHCLLALPGASLSQLTRVASHPQALAQVEMTLSRLCSPALVREAVDDTAGAAKMVAQERLQGVGAVASVRAAEIYGLEILAQGIQDDADNITRFLVLAREPTLPSNSLPFKTSIVFTLERGPGVLFKALSVFALRDINLTKIESRPQRDKPLVRPLSQQQPASNEGPLQGQEWQESGMDASTAQLVDAQGVLSQAQGTSGTSARAPSDREEQAWVGPTTGPAPPPPACQMFDYLFYIDFQASLSERRAQNALRHLQEFAPFLRVLGSYPMDTGIPAE